jgi:hypothetical protein
MSNINLTYKRVRERVRERERERGGERVSEQDKIWDTNKIINTDNLTDDQWDILADIFKDFK